MIVHYIHLVEVILHRGLDPLCVILYDEWCRYEKIYCFKWFRFWQCVKKRVLCI